MIRRLMMFAAITMMLSMVALAQDAEQMNGKVTIVINSVTINRTQAPASPGKTRTVTVDFQWLCQPTGKARLVSLEAMIETINTDGKRSQAGKKLIDWTENRPIDSRLDLPMTDGVFARDFTLTLRGQFKREGSDQLMGVAAVKKGTFPPPPPSRK